MSAEIYVSTRTAIHPAGDPIENVKVGLYTAVGALVTSGFTDALGVVFLGDRAAATYEIRITPPAPGAVSTGANRQTIVVVDGDAMAFDIVIDTSGLPTADDSAFCRCSGLFIDSAGSPVRGMRIVFSLTEASPQLVRDTGADYARGVVPNSVTAKTDNTGYAVIDLLRGQTYRVRVAGYANISWDVIIPDALSAPLPDVVYPYPSTCEFREGGVLKAPSDLPTATVLQGAELTLDLTTVFRSGLSLEGLRGLTLQADTGHWRVDAEIQSHALVLTGLSPGVVNFTVAERAGETEGHGIRPYPAQVFKGNLVLTVTDDAGIPDLVDPADGSVGSLLVDNEE